MLFQEIFGPNVDFYDLQFILFSAFEPNINCNNSTNLEASKFTFAHSDFELVEVS